MQMLNKQTSPSPHLRFFFLCDGVIHRDDQNIDVTRLLTDHLFTKEPLQMPPCDLAVTLVVGIYSEDHCATYPLKVTGEEKGRPEETTFITEHLGRVKDQYTPLMIRRCDLKFFQPGTYWFNLYLDGNLAGRWPLNIEYASTSNS